MLNIQLQECTAQQFTAPSPNTSDAVPHLSNRVGGNYHQQPAEVEQKDKNTRRLISAYLLLSVAASPLGRLPPCLI